jgi:hypothetical protein
MGSVLNHPPPPAPLQAEAKKERVATAVLSTTARHKAKEAAKKAKDEGGAPASGTLSPSASADGAVLMADGPTAGGAASSSSSAAMAVDSTAAGGAVAGAAAAAAAGDVAEGAASAAVPAATSFTLLNPCRVTFSQRAVISLVPGQRYVPVRPAALKALGVVVLADSTPGEAEVDVVDVRAPPAAGEAADSGPEPEAPEPFLWTPPADSS